MKIKVTEVRKLLEKILIKNGVGKPEARVIADEYLEGELQAKYSHGLMAFPSIIPTLSQKREKIKINKKTESLVFIDANYNLGVVVGKAAVDLAVKMARKEGVAVVLIKNMMTWLRPGTIAQKITDRGFIGLVVNNGGKPMVAPPGGYDPVIATNPIGIGIPTSKNPIVIDMATSKRAWGEVRVAEKEGRNLPKETYFDKSGNFTLEPKDAYSVLPAGGYKGFALGLLIEILTGSLVDMVMGSHKLKGDYRTLPRGGFILVINPEKTTRIERFKKANARLVQEIKSSRKLKGFKEIRIPGERAIKSRDKSLKRGYLEINERFLKELEGYLKN